MTDVSDRRSVSIDHDLRKKLAHKRKHNVVVLTTIVTTNVNNFLWQELLRRAMFMEIDLNIS